MPRRKPRAPRPKTPPAPGAWSVMLIDGAQIRKNARSEYEEVQQAMEQAKADLDRFRTEDQPLYERWLNANFGAALTETRELQQKVFEKQSLVSEVQHEFYFGDYRSVYTAYVKVKWRREHPEEAEAELKREQEEAKAFEKDFKEAFRKGVRELFGFEADELLEEQEEAAESDPEPTRSKRGGESDPTPRVKDLYRALARRLHPDAGGHRSAQEIEWWHKAQAAYEAGDVEQMQMILALAEIDENGTNGASVSMLQRLTKQFKRGLNVLLRDLRRYRRDPAWQFSSLKDQTALLRKTRAALESERRHLAFALAQFEKQILDWESMAPRSKPRTPRKRRGEQPSML